MPSGRSHDATWYLEEAARAQYLAESDADPVVREVMGIYAEECRARVAELEQAAPETLPAISTNSRGEA
jgi:hypothetical protein